MKVILICGKIASGKSTYARLLADLYNGIILSCDELDWALFHHQLGAAHDATMPAIHAYLRQKAAQIAAKGVPVILDWGFWQKAYRAEMTAYFESQHIPVEWHYLDVTPRQWHDRIRARNQAVKAGETMDYYIDDGLLQKATALFEKPDRASMDVWYAVKER